MGHRKQSGSLVQAIFRRFPRRTPGDELSPALTPLAVLEELHAGKRRDYCLYLRPALGHAWGEKAALTGPLSVDMEQLLVRAFDPLPMLPVEESGPSEDHVLPDEAFVTLAESARVLCLVPTDHPRFLQRLALLKESSAITRAILLMPEQGTMGTTDWPETWATVRSNAARMGLELSPYTGGGWLFRLGPDGKACTFRPVANPNPEKIAKALEAICGEME